MTGFTDPARAVVCAAATLGDASVLRQHRRRRVGQDGGDYPQGRVSIMAPADPGGGWDETARALQQTIREAKLGKGAEVYNVPGAGGTLGLSQLVSKQQGNADQLMVMGLVMLGAIETNKSPVGLDQVTPIATLTEEAEAIVVPGRLEVPDARRPRRRPEGATRRRSPSPAARPAAPTSCSSACSPRRSASTRRRRSTSPTPAAARRWRRSCPARSTPACPASRSSPTRSRRARCARSRSRASSRSTSAARAQDDQGRRASTSS